MADSSRYTTARYIVQSALLYTGLVVNEGDVESRPVCLGVDSLNELLQHYSNSKGMIPYRKEINFTMNPGQDTYVISENESLNPDVLGPKLQFLESGSYKYPDNETQYPIEIIPNNVYYDSYRALNNIGNPIQIFLQNDVDSSTVIVYPAPSQGFRAKLRGKITLPVIDFNNIDTQLLEIPSRMIYFLKLAVAREVAVILGDSRVVWSPDLEARYEGALRELSSANDIDLSVRTYRGNQLANAQRVRSGQI